MNYKEVFKASNRLCSIFKENEALSKFTRLKIGGEALFYLRPKHFESLKELLLIMNEEKIPFKILGRGTNLLISDGKLNFGVIHILNIENTFQVEDEMVKVSSDNILSDVCKKTFSLSLSGLEEVSLIPGTVGGAVYMNAGAFGKTIFDNIDEVSFIKWDGREVTLKRGEIEYSYRKSNVSEIGIVKNVFIKLKREERVKIENKFNKYKEERDKKQPINERTAGSVFKNPKGDFAGRVLEQLGFKGKKRGSVKFSEIHANFLIAENGAKFEDAFALVEEARNKALECGIELEYEMEIWKNEEY